ncbi:hypothetical protein LOTGIDRAFT_228595 [Lottia gigantea]|uniref:Secreted protein n=1 Tax=Lottia gigantea TaxID=225164 RepID=V4BXL2_LOTGI|nr:hypothetical protein LOTGIDRAFT_228595 [Lottia gigantea]ESO93829.1 hypothetical protein LOTGIDRAFT_228595 [Lottia gigantea]
MIVKVLIILLVVTGYQCFNVCESKFTMHDAIQQCFDDEFIDVIVPLQVDFNTSYVDLVENSPVGLYPQCNNTDAYQRAQLCADSVSRRCVNDTDLLPIKTELAKLLPFLCSHISDLDQHCLQRQYGSMETCMKTEVKRTIDSDTDSFDDALKIICMSYSVSTHCADVNLRTCGIRTRLTYKKLVRFSLPKGCYFNPPVIG